MHKEFAPSGQIVHGKFSARFWDDWGKIWGNSWQIITWPLFPTLPAHLTWPPAISTCSLKSNSGWKGERRDTSTIATGTKHANSGRLQPLLPKIAKSLGSSYTGPRWLIQSWSWKLGLKESIHVITSKYSEILGRLCRIFLVFWMNVLPP